MTKLFVPKSSTLRRIIKLIRHDSSDSSSGHWHSNRIPLNTRRNMSTSASTVSLAARHKPWPVEQGMGWNSILSTYAEAKDPMKGLPDGVCYSQDDKTLTVFDGYEKAMFHLLVLPRSPFHLSSSTNDVLQKATLDSISTLRKSPHALEVLRTLKVTSDELVRKIQLEMMTTFGWKWGVNVGFHATESMKHVHLHVISNEMISPSLKNKKHYNSFHPNAGFFLHLTDVIAETESNSKDRRTTAAYEAILKEPLKSIYNEEEFKTIPKLKAHLELEWENAGVRAKKLIAAASKRKAEGEELERRSKEPKTD